jgi:hypothetical protein
MKKFVLHISALLLGLLLIMLVLDIIYTKIYETSAPRSKFQMFRSMKNKQLDYVFLGSSRVENSINPNIIKAETEKKGLNLGFQGSKLQDIYTVLQLLKTYNIKTDRIYLQMDNNYNMDGYSNIMKYELMPFIRDNDILKRHVALYENSKALYYIPFYRYCVNDYKIGLREVVLNLLRKKTIVCQNFGYDPLFGSSKTSTETLPVKILKRNETFENIQNYCKKNKIDVVYFCAPFSAATKNMDYIRQLKVKIPDLKNYATLIKNRDFFMNAAHLNDDGATFFTRYVINDLGLK